MLASQVLAKVEALAARTPAETRDIDTTLDLLLKILKKQFNAYLIDVMWESKQGLETELRAVKMEETEEHGYTSRPIYRIGDLAKVNSLTGWSYVRNEPVWIVDREGLSRRRKYTNRWDQELKDIPEGTIYEYNRATIRTEICHPLQIYVDERLRRAAGVLNIEMQELIYPNSMSKRLIAAAASVVEQLQSRRIATHTAMVYTRRTINELRGLGSRIESESEPGGPVAFVAMPFSTPDAEKLRKWIEEELRAHGIQCRWPQTSGRITTAIFNGVRSAHFGVVVSTAFNPNVMLEWGYLLGCKKPVIRLHSLSKEGERDPFDIADWRRWDLTANGTALDERYVKKTLREAIQTLAGEDQDLQEFLRESGLPAKDRSR